MISLDEKGTSLEDLLKILNSKEVALIADKSCAAQKLHLRLKKRPLRTLMLSLAELLPGQWRLREDKSYVLELKPSAVQRRTTWWRLYLEERDRALTEVRQLVFKKFREAPYRRRANNPNTENSDIEIEIAMADKQDFLRSLPEAIHKQVAERLLDFRSYNVSGEIPLGYFEETATVVPVNTLPVSPRELLEKNPAVRRFVAKRDVNWNKALLRFSNTGFAVSVSIALPNGDATSTHELFVGNAPETLAIWLNHQPLADVVDQMGKKAPPNWKQLTAYQKRLVWKNLPPTKKPNIALRPRRADALHHIGEQANIEFVSDYYALYGSPLSNQEKSAPLKHSLTEELALFAVEQDSSYKKRNDNVYLVRNNRWYRDDNLEVSPTLLKRWYAPNKGLDPRDRRINFSALPSLEQTRRQIDWMADVTGELDLYQICNGLMYFSPEKEDTLIISKQSKAGDEGEEAKPVSDLRDTFPFLDDVSRILHQYRTIRFYAGLDASMRTAILENRLPFLSLTVAQQKEAISLMPTTFLAGQEMITPQTLVGLQTNHGREVLSFNNLPRLRLSIANF